MDVKLLLYKKVKPFASFSGPALFRGNLKKDFLEVYPKLLILINKGICSHQYNFKLSIFYTFCHPDVTQKCHLCVPSKNKQLLLVYFMLLCISFHFKLKLSLFFPKKLKVPPKLIIWYISFCNHRGTLHPCKLHSNSLFKERQDPN